MNSLMFTSISTGILSGVVLWVAGNFSISAWLLFLGATSYYCLNENGVSRLLQVWLTAFTGVMWASLIIAFGKTIDNQLFLYGFTAVISFFMCFQATFKWLKFIPGTFIGAIAMFASEGDFCTTYGALITGSVFGLLMLKTGDVLHCMKQRINSDVKDSST